MPSALLVYTTAPDRDTAERIAAELVSLRLAACVSVGAEAISFYPWEGQLQRDREFPLTIKCSAKRYAELEEALRSLHPYELPEIVAVPVERGLAGYLDWIDQCTTSNS